MSETKIVHVDFYMSDGTMERVGVDDLDAFWNEPTGWNDPVVVRVVIKV